MLIETHSHCSEFSPDALRSLDALVLEAEQKGFDVVVLTDHYEKNFYDDGHLGEKTPVGSTPLPGEWVFELAPYFERIEKVNRHSKITLLPGLEVGYLPDMHQDLAAYLNDFPFAQVIASVHSMEGIDLAFVDEHPLYRLTKKDAYDRILSTHIALLESPLHFHVLAHVDYLTRYAPYADPAMRYEEHSDLFDQIFHRLIDRQIALEVNVRGRMKIYEKTGRDPGPLDAGILARYREMGGRLVTIAGDVHEVGSLGRFFPETKQYLKSLGFRQACWYECGQPKLYDL